MIGLSVLSLLPMFHIPFPHRWVVGKTDSFYKLADQTIKSIPSGKSLLFKTIQDGGLSQSKPKVLKKISTSHWSLLMADIVPAENENWADKPF